MVKNKIVKSWAVNIMKLPYLYHERLDGYCMRCCGHVSSLILTFCKSILVIGCLIKGVQLTVKSTVDHHKIKQTLSVHSKSLEI